ncbi:MAG: hypothetical protein ABRQ23_02455 [Syntrophomonadaceae bacterium]
MNLLGGSIDYFKSGKLGTLQPEEMKDAELIESSKVLGARNMTTESLSGVEFKRNIIY